MPVSAPPPPPQLIHVCTVENLVDISAIAPADGLRLLVIEHLARAAGTGPPGAAAARWQSWRWQPTERRFTVDQQVESPVTADEALDVVATNDGLVTFAVDNIQAPTFRSMVSLTPGGGGNAAAASFLAESAVHPAASPVKLGDLETWSVPSSWVPPAATRYNPALGFSSDPARLLWAINTVDSQACVWFSESARSPLQPLRVVPSALEPVPLPGKPSSVWFRHATAPVSPRNATLRQGGVLMPLPLAWLPLEGGDPRGRPRTLESPAGGPLAVLAFDVTRIGDRVVVAGVTGSSEVLQLELFIQTASQGDRLTRFAMLPLAAPPKRVSIAVDARSVMVAVWRSADNEVSACEVPLPP